MLLVLPISQSDKNIINDFSNLLKLFGPYKKHDVLYVSKKSDSCTLNNLKNKLAGIFRNEMQCLIDDLDCPVGWPKGPNFFWRETVSFLKKNNNKLPWYWMESDVTPMKKGWLDLLEIEYYDAGSAFMGIIANPNYTYQAHLSGCCIYPPNISLFTNYWKWVHNTDMAFDLVCGSVKKVLENTYHSGKMVNFFRTRNFSLDLYGALTFERIPLGFNIGLDMDFKNQKVNNSTLVIHGCKDSSLHKIVFSNDQKNVPYWTR